MSDLEQQAASWVPPWQRASAPSTADNQADAADIDDIDEEIPADEPWCEVDDDSGSFADSLATPSDDADSLATPSDDADANADTLAAVPAELAAAPDATGALDAAATPALAAEPPELASPEAASPDAVSSEAADARDALVHELASPDVADAGDAEAGDAARADASDAFPAGAKDAEAEDVAGSAGEQAGAQGEPGDGGAVDEAAKRAAASVRSKAKAAKRMAAAKAALAAEDEASAAMVPGQRASEEDSEPLPGLAPHEIMPALEAILMVVDEPVSEILLSQVLDIPAEDIAGTLIELSASYTREGKGFDLRRAAGGWRFYTRADYSAYVERFVLDGQQLRLTQASLETLAVVAYKQPVTRSRISAIRGVNVDGVIRTLVTRGMVEECGNDPDSGAHLYRTTSLFLEKLGLDSVEQLPPLAPFLPDNLDEVEAL